MILKFFLKIGKWIKEHVKAILFGSAAASLTTTAVGIHKAVRGKKINKRAEEIQKAALEKHDQAYQEVETALASLGEAEKDAIDSFARFSDSISKIQGRPQIKTTVLSSVKLPNYEPEELKHLSSGMQMAIAGAGGVGVGALAGLAAFGAGVVVAAPAMIGSGVALCIKGSALERKAKQNERQAVKMSKSVDEIVEFYSELQKLAVSYRDSVLSVYERFIDQLNRVDEILETKTTWKDFSRKEKKTVEITVLLARLLYEMIKTKIVIKQENEDKLEKLNTSETTRLQKQAEKLLQEAN